MSLSGVVKYEKSAEDQGVSEVARSPSGFLGQLKKFGSVSKLPEEWKRKRNGFIARHMAQAKDETLWDSDGNPSRRALALIMWAYMPPK